MVEYPQIVDVGVRISYPDDNNVPHSRIMLGKVNGQDGKTTVWGMPLAIFESWVGSTGNRTNCTNKIAVCVSVMNGKAQFLYQHDWYLYLYVYDANELQQAVTDGKICLHPIYRPYQKTGK